MPIAHFCANVQGAHKWQWSISAAPFPQSFEQPILTVLEPEAGLVDMASPPAAEILPIIMRIGGLGLTAAAILLAVLGYRRRIENAPVLSD